MSNLKELIQNLQQNFTNNLKDMRPYIQGYDGNDWQEFYKLEKNNYTRNLIFQNDDFEIFLIVWDNGSRAKIHDHSDNGCIYKILDGKLVEKRYNTKNLSLLSLQMLNKGQVGYIDNSIGYHSIENKSHQPCVSLHIYSPPNYQTKILG